MPLNRSFTVSREAARGLAERILSGTPPSAPAPTTPAPAHQGRGSANLRLADQILARERHARTVIVPDLEPVDPDRGDVPWLDPELELPDPSFQQQLDEEDEEEPPRDEDGRFARQDEEEEPPPDEEEEALTAAQHDTTVIIVDEDNEIDFADTSCLGRRLSRALSDPHASPLPLVGQGRRGSREPRVTE